MTKNGLRKRPNERENTKTRNENEAKKDVIPMLYSVMKITVLVSYDVMPMTVKLNE